jgi:ArsR family transcriptional regulator
MLKTMNAERLGGARPRPTGTVDADKDLARLAKALGHPLRVKIVRLLANRTTCVCGELVDELPVAQSTVSQHLKILKEAGLIQGTIDRPRVCYCLAPGALRRLKALVDSLPEACQGGERKPDDEQTCP